VSGVRPIDPAVRGLLVRLVVIVGVVVWLSMLDWRWAAGAGALMSLMVAGEEVRRLGRLRSRIANLADVVDVPRPADPVTIEEMARLVEDATGRVEEENARMARERDDLQSILETTSEGILVLGPDRRVELMNDSARRLLEPPIASIGRPLLELTRNGEILEFVEALLEARPPVGRRIQVRTKSGSRWIHLSGTRVLGRGRGGRAVLVMHDLTDLQHLEIVRTDFVANVSHEMRSPLASILGYAETLADGEHPPERLRDYLGRILRNSQRLDDIIRDLIELSRLEHAQAPETRPTDVPGLVREVVAGYSDPCHAKGIELGLDVDSLGGHLPIDAGLVRQALANLVDNAVKYTPAGGRIRVWAGLVPSGPEGDPALEIAVSDSGPGIPPEHHLRIFERFYRVDPARSRAVGGTGLGLSIVKHAAALHGGSVRLESTPGEGSTFRISLPVSWEVDEAGR